MDEARLRQQVCQAAYQLWIRGLITGDSGLVTAELHRRRYLTTPQHARRAQLAPEDIITVDVGGLNIQGGSGISEAGWRLHRIAYRSGMGGDLGDSPGPGNDGKRRLISSTVLADPPIVLALMRLLPADAATLPLPGLPGPAVPVVEADDESGIAQGLRASTGVAVRHVGLLAACETLASALNWLERVEHHARIELATGGPRPEPRPASQAAGDDVLSDTHEEETEPAKR